VIAAKTRFLRLQITLVVRKAGDIAVCVLARQYIAVVIVRGRAQQQAGRDHARYPVHRVVDVGGQHLAFVGLRRFITAKS